MSYRLRPMTPEDLPELSRFLTEGFHTPADSAFATPEVLNWKFFDPRGSDAGDAPRSLVACDAETGRIVGHLGICPGKFRGAMLPAEGVSSQHVIDWLTSATGRGAGATLLRRAHTSAVTQYSFGMSADARAVGQRIGYELVAMVPVMQRVLRVGSRLREREHPPLGRLLRAARDLARKLVRPARRPKVAVELEPVESFGGEIEPILKAYQARAVFFSREAGMLNHLLRYPRGGVTGWHVTREGKLLGFALLSLVAKPGPLREGRIAGCMLAGDDPDNWHAAMEALTRELGRQGADRVVAVASTDWTERALRAAGYSHAFWQDFRLRDRSHAVDHAAVFHLTFLEADAAYT